MRICFVVHRYAPFPGGSEYYVQQMAEECVNRNHTVTVFAGEHMGDLNGVKVTSEPNYLNNQDLIVVHGGDVYVQNFVLSNAKVINSPILYLIIKPSDSPVCVQAMKDVDYIGCSALEDWDHAKKYGVENKAHKVIHGVSPNDCYGKRGVFKDKFNIPKNKRMFLSCGGYWPHKRMYELSKIFENAQLKNSILVTTGYDNRYNNIPLKSENIFPLMIDDPQDVKNAIADADCYIMNSSEEGFGLVILESMLNKTPWISNEIAGAKLLKDFGQTYKTDQELTDILLNFTRNEERIDRAYQYVLENHLIKNTVDDILNIINT